MEHHGHGGSALARQEICPFSYKAEQSYENETNEHSERGTLLHKACETSDLSELNYEDKEQCIWAMERVVEIASNHNVVKAFKEKKLEIKNENGDVLNFGTADVLLIVEDEYGEQKVVVIDYKFGFAPVSVKNNIQLQSYGVGACQEFGLTKCDYWIIQPALAYCACDSFDDVNVPYQRIVNTILETEVENPKVNPDKEACKYCKHRLDCQAVKDTQQGLVVYTQSDISNLQPNEVADILDKIAVLKKIMKDMEQKAIEYIDNNGGEIEGRYKRVTVRGKSKPFNVGKVYSLVPEHIIRKYATIGKTNLEKAFVDANYKKGENTKKALKEAFKTKISPFMEFYPDSKKLIKQ